jgi:hypothetical protein
MNDTTSTRPPHEQRVIDELSELTERLEKLCYFLVKGGAVYDGLHIDEQGRLQSQADAMKEYASILGERIKNFPPPRPTITLTDLPLMSRTNSTIEQEIQAKGLNAPRVTAADVEANIAGVYYFTAKDGVQAAFHSQDELTRLTGAHAELALLTFCVLVLRNGFTVTGESACASPENFNAEDGRKYARENAVEKVWPFMGYAIKQQLHEQRAQKAR